LPTEQSEPIQAQVRNIVVHTWDPLGLQNDETSHSKYDSYVTRITELVLMGIKQPEMEQRLFRMETIDMGINTGDQARRKDASRMLADLSEKL
jgi:hypothetical protein